jgi:hypothetical protein
MIERADPTVSVWIQIQYTSIIRQFNVHGFIYTRIVCLLHNLKCFVKQWIMQKSDSYKN